MDPCSGFGNWRWGGRGGGWQVEVWELLPACLGLVWGSSSSQHPGPPAGPVGATAHCSPQRNAKFTSTQDISSVPSFQPHLMWASL